MASLQTYSVRPFSKPARTDFKDVFRVYFSATALQLLGLHPGDACQIKTPGGVIGPVLVWPAPEKITDGVVQTSRTLQILYDLKLGDKILVLRNHVSIKTARNITLVEVPQAPSKAPLPRFTETDRVGLTWFLEHVLEKAEIVCPGMILEGVEIKGKKRSFIVTHVNCSRDLVLNKIQPLTQIQLENELHTDDGISVNPQKPLLVNADGIGGLDKQLKELNDRLIIYGEEQRSIKFPSYYRPRRGAVILHGPPGTGKSMILSKLSDSGWRKVFRVNTLPYGERSTDRHAVIRDIFAEAHLYQPSLIIIDGIDTIAGKKDPHALEWPISAASTLCAELDRLGTARIFVVAALQVLSSVDENLRSPGHFEFEIEIPVPNSIARAEILKIASGQPKDKYVAAFENLADRTHGFVGADLNRLVQLAVEKGMTRILEDPPFNEAGRPESEVKVEVTERDLENALLDVRPTAMREVFLETPKVRWCDIGGQHEVKKALEQAIEWPFKVWRYLNFFIGHHLTLLVSREDETFWH